MQRPEKFLQPLRKDISHIFFCVNKWIDIDVYKRQVMALANDMEALSDDALREKTQEYKHRYEEGETLDTVSYTHLNCQENRPWC